MAKPVTEAAAETAPSPAVVRAALETVLNSAGFRKSERQANFLRYVCEAVLAGEGPKLHEFMIAQAVFGRGEQYSSTEDSVVRRQAYSVRQKLRNYYAKEGKGRPRAHCPAGGPIRSGFHFGPVGGGARRAAGSGSRIPSGDSASA